MIVELRLDLVKGNKYTYTNTVRVGRMCKRMTKQQTVIYIGSEENKKMTGGKVIKTQGCRVLEK